MRNRELGALLRRYREERNLTAAQVAKDVGLSAAVLSRLETAARTSPRSGQVHVRALAGYYGLDAPTTDRLLRMAKEASEPGWWQRYELESPTATYLDLESAAVSISSFEATVMPGLLQTRDYAKAVISPSRLQFSAEKLEQTVASRIRRQQILIDDNPLQFHVVIDEAILHRTIGSRDVLREQLIHTRRLASELTNVTVRVLPFLVSAYPASDGPFSILNFTEDLPSVIYAEGQLGQLFEDDPDVVGRVERVYSSLTEFTLDPESSLELFDERIHALS